MKKKNALLMLLTTGCIATYANDYTHLTLETKNGTKTSVPLESLTLTIADGNLTTGEQTFKLAELSKMYFTTLKQISTIEDVNIEADKDCSVEVFNLQGGFLKRFKNQKEAKSSLQTGIYIFKTEEKTFKVSIQ